MKRPNGPGKPPGPDEIEVGPTIARRTRRGFLWGGAATLAGIAGWKWLASSRQEGGVPWPLRRVLELDEKVGRAMFSPDRPAPNFPESAARMPRVNGRVGIDSHLDLDRWRLRVQGPAGSKSFSLADVKALPRFEMTTELRCIEGWSEAVTWAGARLADLAGLTGLARRTGTSGDPNADLADLLPFASLVTPDARYFVGLDIASALHPQTLLCYEMNGRPLSIDHGAPLRLAIPVKYGIKSLKQIGTLRFTDSQPTDYWAERGYDWYAGH
jgi:DMSO/TMAO reductase YedYZ molybdopterin-dependent catalytic subunit